MLRLISNAAKVASAPPSEWPVTKILALLAMAKYFLTAFITDDDTAS